jgi:hypothetical protein
VACLFHVPRELGAKPLSCPHSLFFSMRDMAPRIAMAMGTLLQVRMPPPPASSPPPPTLPHPLQRSQNYPERLHRIVFIDMPRLFQAAFQALKLVVDARTIGKVRFSSSGGGGGGSSSSILAAPRHGGSQVIFSAPHSLEQVAGEWMSPELLQVLAAMIMVAMRVMQPRSHFPPFSGSG